MRKYTADDILDMQLKATKGWNNGNPEGHWYNEHLQPTTWRLSGWATKDEAARKAYSESKKPPRGWEGAPIDLDFIGSLENFSDDWAKVVQQLTNNENEQRQLLQQLPSGVANSRGERNRSTLSPISIQKMCASALYKDEWKCLGYPSPCDSVAV